MAFHEADAEKGPEQKPEIQGQGGESCSDPSSDLMEMERLCKEMERWKSEADTLLVFTGLFAAVLLPSIIESYKLLSPDSGDETVARLNVAIDLLTQTSQQFYNNSHGIPVQSVVVASSPQFHLAPHIYAVNVVWSISFRLCLNCAITATLIQQWSRQYLDLTQRPGTPADVRRSLSIGLTKFRANWVCQTLGVFLHVSIILYYIGVVLFIFHISQDIGNKLETLISVCFSITIFLYAVTTILPFFFLDCPYSTPFTPIAWGNYHLTSCLICLLVLAMVYLPLSLLAPSHSKERLLKILKSKIETHMQRFWHGQKRSVGLYRKAADANAGADTNTAH